MNSSAKLIFPFIACAALGAIAFACTTTTSVDNDLDGGTNQNTGTSNGSTSSTTSSSSGSSGTATDTCPQNDSGITIDSVDCQACLDQNCCQETADCYDTPTADPDAGPFGCADYVDQLDDCDVDSGTTTPDDCKHFAKLTAATNVPAAYDTYLACRTDRCSVCQQVKVAPDGGNASH